MKPKVLLVGWDAADWKIITPLIDCGEMPAFARTLVENGVMGDLSTLDPILSPMLWNSIATGKRADRHGILGFTEIDPVSGNVRPVTSTSRRVKALWNILSQNELRSNVVSWFASHPAEPIRGACVSDAFARGCPAKGKPWPLLPGTVHPASLVPVFEPLRMRPNEIDAETLRLFIPRLDQIDRSRPNRLGMLTNVLSECFTTHAAATWLMENTAWDFMAVYYIGIDHFSHAFMNYRPPKMEGLDEREFELYRDVVSGGYRLMDLFLARLLQLAGPDTTVLVISDHGFHSDHLRPRYLAKVPAGPAAQHRPLGIFAIAGPGIRRDERIYGANLLDIAPTVLSLFGLPAANDMPGRVLSEVFTAPPLLARIETWEEVPGESGQHPPGFNLPMDESSELIKHFVALGYLAPQPEDRDLAVAECRRETQWNLARVYLSTWRLAEALPVLEELHAQAPQRGDFAVALADCQLRLGLTDDAEASALTAIKKYPSSPAARFVLAQVAFTKGRFRESLDHLLAAEGLSPVLPELHTNIGLARLRLRQWDDAERAFARALAIDPHSPLAWQGMARVHVRQGKFDEAAQDALSSISCRHDLPLSHFWLGIALARLGRRERAIQAFETSLSFHPPLRIAHRMLARLYGDNPQGRAHAEAAAEFLAKTRSERIRIEALRQEARLRSIDRRSAIPVSGEKTSLLELIIVSGLPRSGTSLMMRMLEAAGLPIMTDEVRTPDDDNPDGYYEWEAIKKIGSRPALLRQAAGKVVKVISMLLPSLPPEHRYKVIFMDRPIDEVVRSQMKMLENRGESPVATPESIGRSLAGHREAMLRGLKKAPGFEVLVVNYPELVESPEKWLTRIQDFLGIKGATEKMRAVIRRDRYRNRSGHPESITRAESCSRTESPE